jgi:threonine/homoserine/homoserine lactone efflux protein
MYILARGAAQGTRAGVLSALGVGTGGLCHTIATATGLSMILASSATAFIVVKWLGAVYLVFLGIRMVRQKTVDVLHRSHRSFAESNGWTTYRQGILCNVLNPKVAVFFLAFLPQFVDPSSGRTVFPFLFLGFVFVVTGTTWCVIVGVGAGKVSDLARIPYGQ